MLSIGPVSFLSPMMLSALAALPVLWLLLRLTPPSPRLIRFPPIRLLMGLVSDEDEADKSPFWLVVLRLLVLISLIFGVAHPVLHAGGPLLGEGPLTLIVDNGWASSHDWQARQKIMKELIGRAAHENRPVIVMPTASSGKMPEAVLRSASEAKDVVNNLQPVPWPVNRDAAITTLLPVLAKLEPGHIAWLTNGLAENETENQLRLLDPFGAIRTYAPDALDLPVILGSPEPDGERLVVQASRVGHNGELKRRILALDDKGTVITRSDLVFTDGENLAETTIELPSELRNRLSRLEVEGQANAASTVLLDERWRRRPVGVVEDRSQGQDQPLLDGTYYVKRALEPFAEVRSGLLKDLLGRQLAMIIIADDERLTPKQTEELVTWMKDGGLVVRFGGPFLAVEAENAREDQSNGLLPVDVRGLGRSLGGSLSWDKPMPLSPPEQSSPLHGLEVPTDVTVRKQILANPSPELEAKTWLRLTDGTPLITAAKRGKGQIILVHTTAGPEWSNLSLSGFYVSLLRRFIELSPGVSGQGAGGNKLLAPLLTLDGYGRLHVPQDSAQTILEKDIQNVSPGPKHPPGFYGKDVERRAINLFVDPDRLTAFSNTDFHVVPYHEEDKWDIRPWLLTATLVLILIDLLATLFMKGVLSPVARISSLLVVVILSSSISLAEDVPVAALKTSLGYILTGDEEIDAVSRAGLQGLTHEVVRRSTAELGPPTGLDPEVDDLAFYPILYWPLRGVNELPSEDAAERLQVYLNSGGLILFDGEFDKPELSGLALVLGLPPLQIIPSDHVLGRSFYLLDEFPGRWTGRSIWVERSGQRMNDRVSSVLAGSHDWSGAWATDDAGRNLFAVIPGGERQREMAYRFGVNLVMYALTGNYKDDQVHLPAILERIGQ